MISKVGKLILERVGLLKEKVSNARALSDFRKKVAVKDFPDDVSIWLIGAGRMGFQFVKAIKSTSKVKLGGICDLNLSAAQSLADKFKLKDLLVTADLADFNHPQRGKGDILVIATTANSHFNLLKWGLDNGFQKIFLEKPLTDSINTGAEMKRLTESANANVYVDHTRRWVPGFRGLKTLLKSGIIGEIHRCYWPFGASGIAMIGSHMIDLIFYLFDEEVVAVRGEFDAAQAENMRGEQFFDPTGIFVFELKSGLEVIVDLSNKIVRKHHTYHFYGSGGRIDVNAEAENLSINLISGTVITEEFAWNSDKDVALTLALSELANGVKPACSVKDGLNALEVVVAAFIAGETKARISLPLAEEHRARKFQFA